MRPGIVVLLSDFGQRDGYAGILRGVLLRLDPRLRIVDLTHEIEPYAVLSAAYILYSAWDHFPPHSVFCAVVDPGVGSERGALLARCADRYLVAPDNGLVSLLARMKCRLETYALNTKDLRFPSGPASDTFHGRDLFAPAAALCAAGRTGRLRGPRLAPVLAPQACPQVQSDGTLRAHILHIDRFGNCITSVHRKDLERTSAESLRARVRGASLQGLRRTYSEVAAGEALLLAGSSDFLEIAVREASAAQRFEIRLGDEVILSQH